MLPSLFADADHRRISRRLESSRIAKVQGGSPLQRLNGYGWRQGVKDETEAAWLTYMYQQFVNVSGRVLAAYLNGKGVRTRGGAEWTDTRIGTLLMNPVYKGEYQYGRTQNGRGQVKAVCQVEALVSPELWASAQDATRRRKNKSGRRGSRTGVYPLQGRLTCAECGRSVGGNSTHKGERHWHYYGCADRFSRERTCTHRTLYPAALIHTAVRELLQTACDSPASLPDLAALPTLPGPDLGAMNAAIDRKLSRLEAAYEAGAYTAPEYAERRSAIKLEREALSMLEQPAAPLPADLSQIKVAIEGALAHADLLEVVQALNLRGVLGERGELKLSINPL